MKKIKILLAIIIILCIAFFVLKKVALNSDPYMKKVITKLENDPIEEYKPTVIPKDTTKLFVEDGNTISDTVVIYVQGGPMPNLDFIFLKDSILNVLPFSKSYKRIYLHQSQTYNSTIVNSANKFTFENAKYEGNISSEMLYRTIHYFKKRNKKVVLFAHSYGSFVTPNYLALKPNIADKIVIMAGRLNMDEKIWKSFSNGKF